MKKPMYFLTGLLFTLATVNCFAQIGEKNYLPVNGDKFVTFGINGQNGTIYYRKYKENSFSQWGIGGNLTFSSTPSAGTSSRYSKVEGTDFFYRYLQVTPTITYGNARRIKINNRMETFLGLNYSVGIQYLSQTENHTLVDSTKISNNYDNPFRTHYSFNNDYYNQKTTSFNINGTISPFLGANYFVTEKLAIGCYYSFGGFNLTVPVIESSKNEIKEQGQILPEDQYANQIKYGLAAKFNYFGYGGILVTYSLR
jgi:hypothetical protein